MDDTQVFFYGVVVDFFFFSCLDPVWMCSLSQGLFYAGINTKATNLSIFVTDGGDKSVFSLYVIHILPVAPNFFMSLTSFGAADEYKLQFLL